jgi:hypothetical protein
MTIRVLSGKVTWSNNPDLRGMSFTAVENWANQKSYHLQRVAQYEHTCVDQPNVSCPACNDSKDIPDGVWTVRCRNY